MRQQITAVIKTVVAVDENEIRKQLEKLYITVESVKVEAVS